MHADRGGGAGLPRREGSTIAELDTLLNAPDAAASDGPDFLAIAETAGFRVEVEKVKGDAMPPTRCITVGGLATLLEALYTRGRSDSDARHEATVTAVRELLQAIETPLHYALDTARNRDNDADERQALRALNLAEALALTLPEETS